ncbi:hypothetical protein FJZ31_09710 [Candidatus Poribacteria bacterium]|nr:hypothetical protein [Candidatus Poribacteria bacterium]
MVSQIIYTNGSADAIPLENIDSSIMTYLSAGTMPFEMLNEWFRWGSFANSKTVEVEEDLEYLEDMVLAEMIQEVEGEESFTPEEGRAIYEVYSRGEKN